MFLKRNEVIKRSNIIISIKIQVKHVHNVFSFVHYCSVSASIHANTPTSTQTHKKNISEITYFFKECSAK